MPNMGPDGGDGGHGGDVFLECFGWVWRSFGLLGSGVCGFGVLQRPLCKGPGTLPFGSSTIWIIKVGFQDMEFWALAL